ncbi:hypothetical protein [uncultured Clostridium sp.]|uniref:hypothetical protein n=1 Tax=uncultured Clostridium sp. TaxID=59620 RepID=UPI00262BE98B|nr:hypothetical protein [uncultured Clostridium sp.]
MNLPEGFGMVSISIVIGAFCVYMYMLEKKAKKMQETEEGKREFYDKYTPNYVKKKHKKIGIQPPGKSTVVIKTKMSKKDRRRAKEENNIK